MKKITIKKCLAVISAIILAILLSFTLFPKNEERVLSMDERRAEYHEEWLRMFRSLGPERAQHAADLFDSILEEMGYWEFGWEKTYTFTADFSGQYDANILPNGD